MIVDLLNQVNDGMVKALEDNVNSILLRSEKLTEDIGVNYKFNTVPHPFTFLTAYQLHLRRRNKLICEDLIREFSSTMRLKRPNIIELISYGAESGGTTYLKREWELIPKYFSSEPSFPTSLLPITYTSHEDAARITRDFRLLLHDNCLEYFHVINYMVPFVVLAKTPPNSHPLLNFGGATFPHFWGGMVINSRLIANKYAFTDQLLHEALHALLFGLCNLHGKLCKNSDSELYHSAYRPDPRPMNGLIHAYFVSKNLINCFSSLPGNKFKELADTALGASQQLHSEIETHARLTRFGKALFAIPEITNPNFLK